MINLKEKIIGFMQKNRIIFFLALPLAVYFYFGLSHLTKFETADEHLWISDLYVGRIQQYWKALHEGEWEKTRINDKPGISLALISGVGVFFEKNVSEKIIKEETLWAYYNPDKESKTLLIYRSPIVIFIGLFSLVIFFLLLAFTKKRWLAVSVASFILTSPILIGISQIINPDTFLWVFSFAAVISFAMFIRKNSIWLGLLSMIFLAFALLSKYVALIFIPFFIVMLLWYVLEYFDEIEKENSFRKKVIISSLGYVIIVIGSIGLFALLMPAAIVKPEIITKTMFRFGAMRQILIACASIIFLLLFDAILLKSLILKFASKHLKFLNFILPKILYMFLSVLFLAVLLNWSIGNNFLNIPVFEVGGGRRGGLLLLPFYKQWALQAKPMLFSLTPISLFFIFFIWIKSIFKKSKFDYLVFIFSLFFPVFFIAVTEQKLLVHVRYAVVMYPFALALAGIGFYEAFKFLKFRYLAVVFAFVAAINAYSIQAIRPFYFNYANSFLPKDQLITTGWGYGGYEAVKYISSQGDPGKMKIWTDYYGVCPFFAGKCVAEGQVKWMNDKSVDEIDYVIVTKDGYEKNKAGRKRINEVFETKNPVWELNIDNRPDNFIRVYKHEK